MYAKFINTRSFKAPNSVFCYEPVWVNDLDKKIIIRTWNTGIERGVFIILDLKITKKGTFTQTVLYHQFKSEGFLPLFKGNKMTTKYFWFSLTGIKQILYGTFLKLDPHYLCCSYCIIKNNLSSSVITIL